MHVGAANKLTSLSLCSGYGGLDLGLHRAIGTTRVLCYVEIESFAIFNMVKKIEAGHMPCAPIYTDLKTLNWKLFSGKVDVITGGVPCQPFSDAGRKKADSDARHLWPYIYRGLKELDRPPLVFLENVSGIISTKLKGNEWADPAGISVLHHVLRELERLGYQTEASIFSAAEIGAPHIVDDAKGKGLCGSRPQKTIQTKKLRQTQTRLSTNTSIKTAQLSGGTKPKMGRANNGVTCRMGDAELLTATDNKIVL